MASAPPAPGRRLMKILWALLALALLLMMLPAAVGSFLDDVYEGSATRTLAHSPEEVWAAVADYETHPLHGVNVKSVRELVSENELPTWEEDLGRSLADVVTLEQDQPRFVRRRSTNLQNALTLEWTCTISPAEAGSEVEVTQKIEVNSGGWYGANVRFWMYFLGEADRGAANFLERLGTSLEGGSAR